MLQNSMLLASNFLTDLLCNTDQCLSYIIIILNILTVFALVFISHRDVSVVGKIIGIIWALAVVAGTVVVVYYHVCIFTILCACFSAISVAVLIVSLFENQKEAETKIAKSKSPKGCFVIYPTDDKRFTFALHSKSKDLLLTSIYKYRTVDDVRDAIEDLRCLGAEAGVENATSDFYLDVRHPKFKVYLKNRKYYVELSASEGDILLKSEPISNVKDALNIANLAKTNIESEIVYFAKGRFNTKRGKRFIDYDTKSFNDAQLHFDIPQDLEAKSKRTIKVAPPKQGHVIQVEEAKQQEFSFEGTDVKLENTQEKSEENTEKLENNTETITKNESVAQNTVNISPQLKQKKMSRKAKKMANTKLIQEEATSENEANSQASGDVKAKPKKRKRWFGSSRKK